MAVLADTIRAEVWGDWMQANREALGGLTKQQLRAAVDAIDEYMHANASAINTAIPQPARGALTTAQKAHIVAAVTLKRFGEGV